MPSEVEMCWRWDLTPAHLFAGFHFIKSEPASTLPQELRPFAVKQMDLPGTRLSYQLAVSDSSVALEVQALRLAQPELPLSGDRRSGILVFDGGKPVGGLIIQGNLTTQGYKLVVRPEQRQKGLALRMLVEWGWQTKRLRVLPKQGITVISAKALLSAHKIIVVRALQEGKPVPPKVVAAIEAGVEAADIIREATRIEKIKIPTKASSL